jgi:ribosomal protein S18 acetylase RimI-like enzyme
MNYRLVRTAAEHQTWLEQLRRDVYQDLFLATWGGWDEARHQRHCAECWERGEIYAIEVDGVRVGMIQLFEHADAVDVGEIQIQPSHQGRGIGTRVLRDTIVRAHAQGKKVSLSTGLKNRRAFELYQRLGFRRVAQTDTHDHMECVPEHG